MLLKSVRIKNFRSIEDLTIDFSDSNFKILVGKNESGKTNILKALSFLSPAYKPETEDIREPLPNEKNIEISCVQFDFKFDQNETNDIYKNVLNYCYILKKQAKIITDGINEFTLAEFINQLGSGAYYVDVQNQAKQERYYVLDKKYKFLPGIKKSVSYVKPVAGAAKILTNSPLIVVGEFPIASPEEHYINADILDLHSLIATEIVTIVKKNLPELIYWKYDESNLLPPSIDIDQFASDSDICIPLKNLFKIAGISNITQEITKAQNGSKNAIRNLLKRVAEHATEHFRNVWKEYENISFFLVPNGHNIDAGIQEENSFSLNQRSDGFKRFITFLLMLSANSKNKELENALIVIDEPDMGLHPSGVRCLRDELINISQNNQIVASTHSIFLIDKENIERHYIVTKKNEKTKIEISEENNIVEEEVLYKALGYSIYDSLKEKNILFEGWRDKELFKVSLKGLPVEKKELKDFLCNIGYTNSTGVKSIKFITPTFELSNKKCLIISDNDKAALEKQKEFKRERVYGTWKRYNEILNNPNIKTGEDYITTECLKKAVDKLKSKNAELIDYPVFDSHNGFISETEKWLNAQNIVDKAVTSNMINGIKETIFSNLKHNQIRPDYFAFLDNLKIILDSI